MAIASVKEQSVCYITVSFYDKTGALATPTSATWEVHDKSSGQVMQAATNMTPIASQYEIEILSSVNTLVDPAHGKEIRVLTIKATYGVGKSVLDEFEYEVIGLSFVP